MIAERTKYEFPNTDEVRGEPGWLSPSSITEFLRCGYCYKLNRIDHVARPLGINLPIGSAVHKSVEQARLSVIEGKTHWAPNSDVAADWFDQEVAQPLDPETGEALDVLEIDLGSKFDSLGKAKDAAVALAKFAVPEILKLDKQRGKIVAVEFNLSMLESPYPFAVQGRLDALYADWLTETKPEDATIMADLKTASRQAAPDEYTAIAQSVYEEFYFHRTRPLAVLVDVVSKTKNPDVVTYPLSIDDYGRNLVHQTVLEVADDISAGRFRMRPNFLCPYIHGLPEFQVAVSGFPEE
jgi:PD-(D/E)XK nuclease superfamily